MKKQNDRAAVLKSLEVTCRTCNYKWIPRVAHPKQCANPECHTRYWDKPYSRSGFKARRDERLAARKAPKPKPGAKPTSDAMISAIRAVHGSPAK